MSREKATKKSSTNQAPATPAKRGRGRPRKTVAKAVKQDHTTVRVVAEDKPAVELPKSIKPLAKAKLASPRPAKTPAPKKPAVNVQQLEKSLQEAVAAKDSTDKRVVQLETELKEERAEKRRLQRTVEHLQSVIAELRAKDVKRSIWPWRRG